MFPCSPRPRKRGALHGRQPLTRSPQRRNGVGAIDQQALGVLVKGVWMPTFHINRPIYLVSFRIKNRYDDFRPSRTQSGQVTRIGNHVAHVNKLAFLNRRTGEAFANREPRILGCARPVPRKVDHLTNLSIDVIKTYPSVTATVSN